MASSLRAKFKATSVKALRKQVDTDNDEVGVQSNEYIQLEDGKTLKIRIFPAHPDQEGFYIKRCCYWMSWEGRDGEMHRGTVADSVVHGGTKMDIVREYVKYGKKKYDGDQSKIDALVGTGMKSKSLNPSWTWLCYADIVSDDKMLTPKIWEFKKSVRDALNRLTFSEDGDEPIEIDPFTDVDEGLPVYVKYNKNPKKGEDYYELSFGKKPKARALTDEELEIFEKKKPLSEIIPRYTIKDFDRALEGLQNFDEEFEMGIFDDDDWLEIVEQVKAQYEASEDDEDEAPKKKVTKKQADDEDDDEEEQPKKSVKKDAKKKPEPEPEPEDDEDEDEDEDDDNDEEESKDEDGDEFDDMDRTELKKYIKSEGLDVVVRKTMSDDDLRDAIREAKKAAAATDEDEPEDTDDDEDDDDDDAEEQPKSKLDIAAIRKRLAKK